VQIGKKDQKYEELEEEVYDEEEDDEEDEEPIPPIRIATDFDKERFRFYVHGELPKIM
jgi:hypothetical protein